VRRETQSRHRMSNHTLSCRIALRSSIALLLLLSYRIAGSDRLEVRIVDDTTGDAIAATVVVTDGDGKLVEIEGKHPHVGYLGKRRCYVDGTFSLASRPTRLTIDLRRGLETMPLLTEVDLNRNLSTPAMDRHA